MPFTFEVTEKEPFSFSEEGIGCRVDGITLLKGEDCVVYNEHSEFGRLCLGRLIYPHSVNVTVQMEAFTEEMKITVESLNGKPCEVAVSGCLREDVDDMEDMPSEMGDDDDAETAVSEDDINSGVTIEEVSSKALQDQEVDSEEDEEDSEIGEAAESESDSGEEDAKPAVKKAGAVTVVKTGSKKDIAAKKQAASPKAAVKAAARPEPVKAAQSPKASDSSKNIEASNAKTESTENKEDSTESAKTGVKKSLGRGLSYEVLAPGKGQMAVQGKNAVVKYQLNLARTGQKIDSGSLKFRVGSGEVVTGFDKGVKGMCVNEKRRIFVPSDLGYGKKKTGNIPPNSDLVFEVTLVAIKH